MKKKLFIIIPVLLLAIGGGFMFAQWKQDRAAAAAITAEQAREAALALYPGTVVGFEFDGDDFTPHYEVEIESDTERVEVKVNAKTAKAVIKEREAIIAMNNTPTTDETNDTTNSGDKNNTTTSGDETKDIEKKASSLQDAINIALSKASGKVTKAEFDRDDNVYEIEIRNGKMEYEFEIDKNGNIVIYEEDLDD